MTLKNVSMEIVPNPKLKKKDLLIYGDVHKYGMGQSKKIAVFYEPVFENPDEPGFNGNKRWLGYKYMLVFTGLTKQASINEAYQILTTDTTTKWDNIYKITVSPNGKKVPIGL